MKRKILLVYQSKTGFTQSYARQAAKETGCELLRLKDATAKKLSEYDGVVFGSRAHAGRIDRYAKMRRLLQRSGVKNFALFVTGATPNKAKETVEDFWKQNLAEQELSKLPHFYLQSGLCYEKMGLSDRLLMKMAAAMLRKKEEKSAEDQAFEAAISNSYDISSEQYLEPLVEWIRREQAGGKAREGMSEKLEGR